MSPIEAKLIEAWREFKTRAETQMGYTNTQNVHECINGAGAFIDFLLGQPAKDGNVLCDGSALAHFLMRAG